MPSRLFSRRCRAAVRATAERGHRMRERPRILVVEDDFLVATLVAEILESVGWQVVRPVAHLATALDSLRARTSMQRCSTLISVAKPCIRWRKCLTRVGFRSPL